MKLSGLFPLVALLFVLTATTLILNAQGTFAAQPAPAAALTEPTYSGPIAINSTNTRLVVANPEKDSVTIVDISGGNNLAPAKITEIPVGHEPRHVTISTDDAYAYVTNQGSGTVTVIDLSYVGVDKTLTVGAEPYGIAVTPEGSKVFVANSASNTISVIDTASRSVVATIDVSGTIRNPRGLAITTGAAPFVYVTQFLSFAKSDPRTDQMKDDGKVGKVLPIGVVGNTYVPGTVVSIQPIDSGFTSTASMTTPVKTFPNQLQAIVISGTKAYIPNVGASPQRPAVFDSSTQALISVIDISVPLIPTDPSLSINTNKAVAQQTAGARLFYAVPWAMAFEPDKTRAWAVSLAAENIFALQFDANGAPSVVTIPDPITATLTRTLEIPMTDSGARSPTGIVIRKDARIAYVVNEVSRSLTTINLATLGISSTLQLSAMPTPGSEEDRVNVGKELFNTAIGVFERPGGGAPIKGRMSRNGWQACVSCHPSGLTDGVIWQFAAGPRKSIAMDSTFNPHDAFDQRFLNFSALNDEVADFENNTRGVSGGAGTIISSTSPLDLTPLGAAPLGAPNLPKPQLTVRGFKAQEAITAYFASTLAPNVRIRTPNAPLDRLNAADVGAGKLLFFQAGCQNCHNGGKWTSSRLDYAGLAPPAGRVFTDTAQPTLNFIRSALVDVGTFGTGVPEIAANGSTALGGPNGTMVNNTTSNGNAVGYNIPSLLGVGQFAPYFHNGACETLECVLSDTFITHRKAGRADGVDVLDTALKQRQVAEYLRSIDANTPFPRLIDLPVILR